MNASESARLRVLREDESVELPESLARAAGSVGLDPWTTFIQRVYGFRFFRIVSVNSRGETDGWLAVAYVRHPVFGDYFASSPFGSYGGFAYASLESRDGLLTKARILGTELGVEYVNIRFDGADETPPEGWIQHPIYATYRVDLPPDTDTLMSSFSSDHRNHVRKSQRKGFSIKVGHLELLDPAYEALARSMHELGSPYHSRSYLRAMAESLHNALEFAVLYGPRGELAGAGVFIRQQDVVTNLHANILRAFRRDYAGEYLYWSVMEHYSERGCRVFDLGRSLIGSGNEAFKMKWKPRRQVLAYWYALISGESLPELNQKNPKFQLAIRLWRRLPAFVVRALGPALIRGLA